MSTTPLFYHKIGNGAKHLILFHGFGQTHEVYNSWLDIIPADYTIYAVDLYHHGQSTRKDHPLSLHEWKLALNQLLEENRIESCQIAGFSLGGRFALASAMNFPEKVKQLILLAPDGIYLNPWYRLATSPVGHGLFKHLMYHPSHFVHLLHSFQRFRLATPGMIRFAQKELQEDHKRKQIYQTWTYFKSLRPPTADFTRLCNAHNIQIDLILGDNDAVIPMKQLLAATRYIHLRQTHILPCKHHQLIDASKSLIPSLLQKANL